MGSYETDYIYYTTKSNKKHPPVRFLGSTASVLIAKSLQGYSGSRLGGSLLAVTLSTPVDLAPNDYFDGKFFGVIRSPLRYSAIVRSQLQKALAQFLKKAPGIFVQFALDDALQLRLNERGDEIPDRLKTLIQIYGSYQGLKSSTEIGQALPAAALSLTMTDEQILPQVKLNGKAGQGLGLYQSRP
jgi:hypothetical protein